VNSESNSVAEYVASTGQLVPTFAVSGLDDPLGLAISGNNLFVSNEADGTIGEYNATTGAPEQPTFIAGLDHPDDIAISGNDLFIVDAGTDKVLEYDISTPVAVPVNTALITGLYEVAGITIESVPEPTASALLISSVGVLALRRARTSRPSL
jgi:hypothetical protein